MKRSIIYKAIRDKAKSELDYLQFIDLQKGQMKNPRRNYPVPLPALFVEIGNFRFSNMLDDAQKGDGLITISLYIDINSDSFDGAESENETIELLDHFDELFETFQGLSIENCTPLVRETEAKPQYGTRFILFEVSFSTSVDDAKDNQKVTIPGPPPDFQTQYKFS